MKYMQAMRAKRFHFKRTDVWREGKWFDLWSVVHLLSGASVGFSLYAIHFRNMESYVIAFVLFVAYEFWEAMVDIKEAPTNRFMDVVIGMVSFAPAFLFAPILPNTLFWGVFAAVLTVNIVMAALGWVASRKAAALEQRLRARYERSKLRRQARIQKLQEMFKKRND